MTALNAIVEALAKPPEEESTTPSLSGGDSGYSLLFTYLAQVFPGRGYDDVALVYLERAFDGAARLTLTPGLYIGYSGIAWTAQHLRGRLLDPDEDTNEEIDAALEQALGAGLWPEYDLIRGLVGIGVYAIERLPQPAAVTCLDAVLSQLAQLAVEDHEGLRWWSTPLRPGRRADHLHDVGLAHGVAGAVSLLAEICRVAPPELATRARPLLDGTIKWLLGQRLPQAGACFPAVVEPGFPSQPTRSAWCYGDPGVGMALLGAGRAVGVKSWCDEALATLHGAAARPIAEVQAIDPGLCHGTAGLAHLYHRAYRATGDEALGAIARSWFERTLEMHHPGEGVGGFRSWQPTDGGDWHWVDDPGLLTGSTGIALALLSAVAPVVPAWDRMLGYFALD
jgi:lantibiotic modifying enzyme